jgi:cell division control protein 6
VFAFNFIPDFIPGVHEPQLKKLLSIYAPLIRKGIPQNAFIQGRIGMGKTTLAKRFCHELEAAGKRYGQRIVAEVVNCRTRNTSSEILHYLLASRFNLDIRERGFSVPELLDILRQILSGKCVQLVIVLDNVGKVRLSDCLDILHDFSRLNEEEDFFWMTVSIVLVSYLNT